MSKLSVPNPGNVRPGSSVPSLPECLAPLAIRLDDPATLPFAEGDASAGVENEMQVAVLGGRGSVDLPSFIDSSSYLADISRRVRAGDTPSSSVINLERYLGDNQEQIWENSWVRFPFARLGDQARNLLLADLRADKRDPNSGPRKDAKRFFFAHRGQCWVRLPISYLLKLALADIIEGASPAVRATGRRLLSHFLNDNTSPETFSFHVVYSRSGEGIGAKTAKETGKRFLLSHLLLLYANRQFGLEENGQRALIFFSPHPPLRQRQLNDCVSDAFYRELFMSPCLSGWDDGEGKHRYMGLCHQVLSRSHLNAVLKLREAGIIVNNLVVLPHTSNISLANNGTHISMGSARLGRLLAESNSGFGPAQEKYLGDIATKIIEHFLPLFVGTYSAAPYRIAYEDFHPEKVLAFLPHQLDYSHLRMLWRRWKKKARIRLLGQPVTPFGPQRLDRLIGRFLGMRGDFVPDFRLIDYPVSLLSTGKNCGQDGCRGNEQRLKADLETMGVFDRGMSLYQLCKLREYEVMGFSGFEARYYSLFPSLKEDMARAADLQRLLNCLAFKYMAGGICDHRRIPGNPEIESERRQIFFGAAIGLPTFFVRHDTKNAFLAAILAKTRGIRPSRRYPGYLRVHNLEYRLALLRMIREDGADLVELFKVGPLLDDLEQRLREPEHYAAWGKLSGGIMGQRGWRRLRPYALEAQEFTREAERYYRKDLRDVHLGEGLDYLAADLRDLDAGRRELPMEEKIMLRGPEGGGSARAFLAARSRAILRDDLAGEDAARLVRLLLLVEECEAKEETLAAYQAATRG